MLDNLIHDLFDDIGTKMKSIAKVVCKAGIILSLIAGALYLIIGMAEESGALLLTCLLTAGLGSVFSFLGSIGFYAFGEMVENSCIQTEILLRMEQKNNE